MGQYRKNGGRYPVVLSLGLWTLLALECRHPPQVHSPQVPVVSVSLFLLKWQFRVLPC